MGSEKVVKKTTNNLLLKNSEVSMLAFLSSIQLGSSYLGLSFKLLFKWIQGLKSSLIFKCLTL